MISDTEKQIIDLFTKNFHSYYEAFWKLLHFVAYTYEISNRCKIENVFLTVSKHLTCQKCVDHWEKHIQTIELESKHSLMLWLFNVHNDINKNKNKQLKTKEEFYDIDYYQVEKFLLENFSISRDEIYDLDRCINKIRYKTKFYL